MTTNGINVWADLTTVSNWESEPVRMTSLLIDDCRNSHGDSNMTWERI